MQTKKKKFPDLNKDGKITRADVLKGRGVFKEGGKVKKFLKELDGMSSKERKKVPSIMGPSSKERKKVPSIMGPSYKKGGKVKNPKSNAAYVSSKSRQTAEKMLDEKLRSEGYTLGASDSSAPSFKLYQDTKSGEYRYRKTEKMAKGGKMKAKKKR